MEALRALAVSFALANTSKGSGGGGGDGAMEVEGIGAPPPPTATPAATPVPAAAPGPMKVVAVTGRGDEIRKRRRVEGRVVSKKMEGLMFESVESPHDAVRLAAVQVGIMINKFCMDYILSRF